MSVRLAKRIEATTQDQAVAAAERVTLWKVTACDPMHAHQALEVGKALNSSCLLAGNRLSPQASLSKLQAQRLAEQAQTLVARAVDNDG
jgi:hypothetical protein